MSKRKTLSIWEATRNFQDGGYDIQKTDGWWLKGEHYHHREFSALSVHAELGSAAQKCWATSRKALLKHIAMHLVDKVKSSKQSVALAEQNLREYEQDLIRFRSKYVKKRKP